MCGDLNTQRCAKLLRDPGGNHFDQKGFALFSQRDTCSAVKSRASVNTRGR